MLKELDDELDDLSDLQELIEAAIEDEPPFAMKEGGIIKDGYNETVDKYRNAKKEGKQWLSELEASEREKNGNPYPESEIQQSVRLLH